jgi:hypothetical protein
MDFGRVGERECSITGLSRDGISLIISSSLYVPAKAKIRGAIMCIKTDGGEAYVYSGRQKEVFLFFYSI